MTFLDLHNKINELADKRVEDIVLYAQKLNPKSDIKSEIKKKFPDVKQKDLDIILDLI